MLPFARQLEHLGYAVLQAGNFSTLQVNLGWRCNQACKHCHLMAGLHRPEQMQRNTIDAIIRVVERWTIPRVDLTGGRRNSTPITSTWWSVWTNREPISSPGAT